ncbi:glycosyltransferase family 4 protein [Myroides sp. DW712]|uniref:glycosyltransferase family 4 protein n=1 Tax=Myroides sp. DW712 TaxID=3389800 RepID=UPI00397DA703
MKLALITSRYPKENQPYNHMFVHVRALYFQSQGVEVTVLVPAKSEENYTFQGIAVKEAPAKVLVRLLTQFDVLYLHLLNQYPLVDGGFSIYNAIRKKQYNTAIYLHGADVLLYPDGFFDFKWKLKSMVKVCYTNGWKRYAMARFFKKIMQNKKYAILTPSKWLASKLQGIYGVDQQAISVIPNGIDVDFFTSSGGFESRYKMLCIRPLNSEYPVEDCVRLMQFMPDAFTLDIYGEGEDYPKINQLIQELKLNHRVRIVKQFFVREELPQLFQQYGIFNAFSKSDTQGVTMCEAMASKLLVLSTNKTAIPEFIQDNKTGLLYDEQEGMEHFAQRIVTICKDREAFDHMITSGRIAMQQINWNTQGEKELTLLRKLM